MVDYHTVVRYWKQKDLSNIAEISAVLESYNIIYAYNSGKIENPNITYHDTREIFENNSLVSYTGDTRTIFELQNSKYASEYLLTALENKLPLDECLLKKFHKILTKGTYDQRRWDIGERPGEYKKHDYVTGEEEVGTIPEWVKEEIDELLDDLVVAEDKDALVAAAFFHAKFENIHPFADGNGRTGRLCMNYILLSHEHPPIAIFEEDKKEYYSALEAWDKAQSLDELVSFLKKEAVKTWQKSIERSELKNFARQNNLSGHTRRRK